MKANKTILAIKVLTLDMSHSVTSVYKVTFYNPNENQVLVGVVGGSSLPLEAKAYLSFGVNGVLFDADFSIDYEGQLNPLRIIEYVPKVCLS